jgi:RNA polymerase sigma factor (sigma-70 family)
MAIELIKKEFTAFYEKENQALFRFCLWRVSHRETALELAQESFARLWSRMASGRKMEQPRAFLYVTARNLIIDWYRKSRTSSLEALSEDAEKPFDRADERAQEVMEISPDAKRALSLIDRLEDQYREVVYMSFVEELPPREIALILNITPNAVSIRLSRGLEALREMMGIDKPQ